MYQVHVKSLIDIYEQSCLINVDFFAIILLNQRRL